MVINYVIDESGVSQLNDFFTAGYNYKYFFFRLKTIDIILEDIHKFVDTMADEELKKENISHFQRGLQSEVICTFFHMTETLFALMIAVKSEVPWLWMKSYRVHQIMEYIRTEILTEKISDEDLRYIFYNGVKREELGRKDLQLSIKFIRDYLKRIGELYLDNTLYDEYKHGVRVILGTSGISILRNGTEHIPLASSDFVHTYLTSKLVYKQGKTEYHQVSEHMVTFDYELHKRLCIKNYQLIEAIFHTRQQKSHLQDGDQIGVTMFDHDSINDLFKPDTHNTLRKFRIDFPGEVPVHEPDNGK
jgi:hypothetical protein